MESASMAEAKVAMEVEAAALRVKLAEQQETEVALREAQEELCRMSQEAGIRWTSQISASVAAENAAATIQQQLTDNAQLREQLVATEAQVAELRSQLAAAEEDLVPARRDLEAQLATLRSQLMAAGEELVQVRQDAEAELLQARQAAETEL